MRNTTKLILAATLVMAALFTGLGAAASPVPVDDNIPLAPSYCFDEQGKVYIDAAGVPLCEHLVAALGVNEAIAISKNLPGLVRARNIDLTDDYTWNGAHVFAGTVTISSAVTLSGALAGATPICFDGATAGTFKTCFALTDPAGSNKTITFPNASGTVPVPTTVGTTTTLLHGNAGGAPTYAAASLTADVSGTLPVVNGGTGATSLPTRSIGLPLGAWYNCTTPAALPYTDAADAHPSFFSDANGSTIMYDATGGSIDTEDVCTTFIVPNDYSSGGTGFTFTLKQATAQIGNLETWLCDTSKDRGVFGADAEGALLNQTGVQEVALAVTTTVSTSGEAVTLRCRQSNAAADDTVYLIGAKWQYTSTR